MEKPRKQISTFEFLKSPWYQKERDGELGSYLKKRCIDGEAETLFRGIEAFNLLKEKKLFKSGFTMIRVMWNVGRGDEYYTVVENNREIMLKGITSTGSHDGNPGLHKPEAILEGRKEGGDIKGRTMCFELHHPSLEAINELVKRGE